MQITKSSYAFVEKPSSWMYSVHLKEGIYSGIIVTYGKVGLKPSEDESSATLSFQYRIDEIVDPYSKEELETSAEFRNYLGDVLSHIISSAFESGEYKIGNGNKPSVNNTSEAHSR